MARPKTPQDSEPALAPSEGKRTLAGWRGGAIDLQLAPEDLALLDNVLAIAPVLRIVTAIGQEARRRGLRYPVADRGALQSCIGADALKLGGHRIDADAVAHMMPESWFPIAHEGELLSRVHLALLRCEFEAAQAAPRPAFQLA
ncbi:hypothetical protein [Sphingomonas cavernae]|uniref:Uncharacterized protein n=1 Tax=Sphingomonas cavernae TaxID=2320861 RepID=A0A418WK19_9SPHN|nr:hypothetical protein [Sphingomonas cavernae]RJF90355.1 hypothetical protein D3876_08850 [Sphingomonas cavernae]